MPSMVSHLFFKLSNEKDSELEACEYLDTFAKKCGFASESIDEMRLAFIEGLINAKEHAPKDVPDGNRRDIHVALTWADEMLQIQIRDFGRGFDPTVVEKPDIRKKLKSSHKRGWGLMLMERLMDGAEITSFPPSGTLIQLVKKRLTTETPTEVDTMRERKRVERLKYILGSFIDLSSFLCQSKNLQAGLRSMLRILLGTMGVSRGAIYTFENANESLDCLVDIKLRANARLPQVKISPKIFEKLAIKDDGEVTEIVKNEISAFKETFKDGEIEHIYVLRTDDLNQGLLILGSRFRKEEEETLDKELLTTISRNISSAINTYRLMQNLRDANEMLDRRVQELDSVREASEAISSELEIENLPFTVEGIFRSVMNVQKFSMAVFDPTENRYNICHNNRGLPATLDLWSSPVSQHVIHKMEPLYVPDVKCEERFAFTRSRNYASDAFAVIPIVVQEEVLALVNLSDKDGNGKITQRDFDLAQLLCSQLGIAIKNANLYKRGITDGLTRLYTNHYFKMRLSQEISRLRRVKSSLTVMMAGVDNIESLLDKHGAGFKDTVLVKVGSAIKRIIRFNDLPCRYEGDKFSIILPDTGVDGAKIVADKILENMNGITIKHHDIEERITLSIAISQFKVSMNIGQLIESAERTLCEAQKAGGNRVVTEEPA
ncbi:MAG: diguanylate cyclase [Erysipelotrichia bacterium]|nr:diguanylate cyclase [Erysipelotrichia bacterium]